MPTNANWSFVGKDYRALRSKKTIGTPSDHTSNTGYSRRKTDVTAGVFGVNNPTHRHLKGREYRKTAAHRFDLDRFSTNLKLEELCVQSARGKPAKKDCDAKKRDAYAKVSRAAKRRSAHAS